MNNNKKRERVLIGLLPFWTPLIPPLGISCLKSHLKKNGYEVMTFDANMNGEFRDIYDKYFLTVESFIPKYKRGNFFNVGMEVMRNQMMAYINCKDQDTYNNLIRAIFYHTFYVSITDKNVNALSEILEKFYQGLADCIRATIKKFKPDVFGLSVFSGSLPASLYAFRLIKEENPSIMTVMGGGTFSMELHVQSPNFSKFLEYADCIDKILVGEGENLFLALLENRLPTEKKVHSNKDIVEGNIDVKLVSPPDFDDFELDKYPQLGAWSSRSCPFQCSFCSETIHWGNYRKKAGLQIADELIYMSKKYGRQVFMMGDSLLNIVIDSVADSLISADSAIYWDGYLRSDPPVCKIENTLKWRAGGLYRARLGVESGSQRMLDIMHKKITVDQIRESVKCLARSGVKTTTYWVIGHPGETDDDFKETLDLVEELKDYLWEAECNPFSYFLTGQVDSDLWMSEYKKITLYPEETTDLLITQTWLLKDCYPSREKTYERVMKFVAHCEKLGIPNPYFEYDIFNADKRWQQLHANAVPPLIEFKEKMNSIDECKRFRKSSDFVS